MKNVYDAFKKIIESSQKNTMMLFYEEPNLKIICRFPYNKADNNEKFWEQMNQVYEPYEADNFSKKTSLPRLNCKFPFVASHIRNSAKFSNGV